MFAKLKVKFRFFLFVSMTAPLIPPSALKFGESNIQVTGELILLHLHSPEVIVMQHKVLQIKG